MVFIKDFIGMKEMLPLAVTLILKFKEFMDQENMLVQDRINLQSHNKVNFQFQKELTANKTVQVLHNISVLVVLR